MSAGESRETERHEGGCLCGAVRYRVTGPIESVAHCHCSMCRRASGAVAVTWFTIPPERFEVTKGELASWKSSAHGERTFCPSCGAQIGFASSQSPGDLDITLGTLDHPERYPADHHVWTESRLAWLHLDEALPGYAGDTPPDAA